MKYHICTSFRASSEFYRGINSKQARIGQDYITSVNIYRDTSCLVIKPIEDQNIGIIMKGSISKEAESETVVAFVDDTDFATSGDNAEYKMQAIINLYNKYYIATGGYIEHSKTVFYM